MKDANGPLVTVIVPAKDDAQYLRPCLRSIREQGFKRLECVVVDDGSADDTLAIAEEFSAKDDRFSVTSHATSRGPSAARNTGLASSTAPFVTFLDADDFLYKGSIRRRLKPLLDSSDRTVAGTFCDWQSTPQNKGPVPPERAATSRAEVLGFIHGPECPFIITAPMVRREVLEEIGGFDEDMHTAEDFELWIRVLREGYTFRYIPIIGVAYRQNASGLVFSKSAEHAEESMAVIDRQYEDVSNEQASPFLSLPLPHYQRQCARVRRLLRTYALAAATGEADGAERIEQLISSDLDVLARAGLDVEAELRAGVWRASRALTELKNKDARDKLIAELLSTLAISPG